MTLTEFLLARIAEDEAGFGGFGPVPLVVDAHGASTGDRRPTARVLARCKADRRIVTACSEVATIDRDSLGAIFAIDACRYTLRAMANVYADHPDYREEWKP